LQIRDLEQETSGAFKLDAIATVIDAENFTGYEDTSTTARMQAAYTDLLLIVRINSRAGNIQANNLILE
jgi:G3E family GTPase